MIMCKKMGYITQAGPWRHAFSSRSTFGACSPGAMAMRTSRPTCGTCAPNASPLTSPDKPMPRVHTTLRCMQ